MLDDFGVGGGFPGDFLACNSVVLPIAIAERLDVGAETTVDFGVGAVVGVAGDVGVVEDTATVGDIFGDFVDFTVGTDDAHVAGGVRDFVGADIALRTNLAT